MPEGNTSIWQGLGQSAGLVGGLGQMGMTMTGPIGWGIMALGAGISLWGAASEQREAQKKLRVLKDQKKKLEESKFSVGKLKSQKKTIAKQKTEVPLEQLATGVGTEIEKLGAAEQSMLRKTGMETVTEVGKKAETQEGKIFAQHDISKKAIYGQLGETLMGIDLEAQDAINSIDEKLASMSSQEYQLKRAAKSRAFNLFT
ncbi:hypothetical protein CMI37_21565 [Candidatus Pacearchaeota archaeon]|jgi:hypothetical protein|nr:hypothetical protein [Candidatus Pacearchaeota archaeon]|tara:strand:+ start:62 stop:664 length:603 start_codon:yes stop_codon:yes gene_type:complete